MNYSLIGLSGKILEGSKNETEFVDQKPVYVRSVTGFDHFAQFFKIPDEYVIIMDNFVRYLHANTEHLFMSKPEIYEWVKCFSYNKNNTYNK